MLLGAHLSIAGGLHNALIAAGGYRFRTVGLFVRNQLQWRVPTLSDEAAAVFRRTRRRLGVSPVVAHGSYLVNLAGKHAVRRRSITATLADLTACGRLGIEYLVLHPGSRSDADEGIRLIAEALDGIFERLEHRRPKVLLETMAGAGNCIGHTFEQIAAILARVRRPRRLGVCLDTCHAFAAGYDMRTARAYRKTMAHFDRVIGLKRLLAVHLNDSLAPLGSRRDRHEHIGRGHIGKAGFANFVNDRRLTQVPMILETPKGKDSRGRDWDEINAETIRGLRRPGR
ncbi:MAG: deoxyribonuclease IV [Phycisphaerae bacterium]